ncbi:hypothetical protein IAT40_006057 [Kwoniella sp. CBS 6097]
MAILTSSPKHFFICPLPVWGHLRPGISLIPNILKRHGNAYITILIPFIHAIPAAKEFERYDADTDQLNFKERVKVIHYGEGEKKVYAKTGMVEFDSYMTKAAEGMRTIYPKILDHEPVFDRLSQVEVQPFAMKPDVVILDIGVALTSLEFAYNCNKEKDIKVSTVLLSPTGSQHAAWALVDDPRLPWDSYISRARKIAAAPEAEKDKVYNEVLGENEDLIHIVDSAPIYVFEAQPIQPDMFHGYCLGVMPILPLATALVHAWPAFMGQGYKKTMAELGTNVLQIGAQLPDQSKNQTTLEGGPLKDFLDKALAEKGKDSVIYISFGTLLFPAKKHQLSILLDVLIALDMRFVLARGIASPEIQAMAKEKIDAANGTGIYIDWAPQFGILSHEATGWFLTHGGSNSTMEGLRMRVPMLFWPCDADQVWIANSLSKIHGAGYEFLQIRNGPSIGRTTYSGVNVEGTKEAIRKELEEVFGGLDGEFGKKLREGAKRVGKQMDEDPFTEEDWAKLIAL